MFLFKSTIPLPLELVLSQSILSYSLFTSPFLLIIATVAIRIMHNTAGDASRGFESSPHSLEDLSRKLEEDTTPGVSTPTDSSGDNDGDGTPRDIHGYKVNFPFAIL